MNKLLKISGSVPFLIIVFLNAWIDIGHKIIIQNTVFKIYNDQIQVVLTTLINALILFPFVLLMSPAGFVADRYAKNHVMRYTGWLAVITTLCITFCYYQGWFWPAFLMTLILAIQSAFYGPAKLSYLTPLFGKNHLAESNALTQAASITAILTATGIFSWIFESRFQTQWISEKEILIGIAPIGWLLVVNSLVELALIYRLPTLETKLPKPPFDWQAYRSGQLLLNNLSIFKQHPIIRLSIIGLSIFWSVGQVMLAAFPAHVKSHYGITNTLIIQGAMAASGIGIALGAWLAGRWSRSHIETGLIPMGALGVALGLMVLPSAQTTFLQGLTFFAIGFSGSFFIVPLNALIQFNAGDHERGRILAVTNWVQTMTMLLFLSITLLVSWLGLNTHWLLYLIALVACIGCLYTLYKLPQSLVRFLFSWVMKQHYRINVQGIQHIPEKGGVLLLGNHISWIDWAIVQIACPRPIRFVMIKSIYDRWYITWFLRLMGCIPIEQGPKSEKAIETMSQLLTQGEVICLFPEGLISRTGHLATFRQGYLRAANQVVAPIHIIPFYLRGLWGSQFSRASSKLQDLHRSGITRDLVVAFGQAQPKNLAPERLKQKIFDLSMDTWAEYARSLPSLATAWIHTAKQSLNTVAVIEQTLQETKTTDQKRSLTYRELLTETLLLSRQFKNYKQHSKVGFLLPSSIALISSNLAAIMAGKIISNLNYTLSYELFTETLKKTDIKLLCTTQAFFNKLIEKGYPLEKLEIEWFFLDHIQPFLKKRRLIMAEILVSLAPGVILNRLFNRNRHPEKCAAIVYSSGNRALPKPIQLSHQNMMANIKQTADVLNIQEDDVLVAALPSFHVFAITINQLMPIICGNTVVCHPNPMDVIGLAKLITQHDIRILCATPALLDMLTRDERIHPLMLQPLRLVLSGGKKLSENTQAAFEAKFNKSILQGYGTTETTPVASMNLPDQLDTRTWKVQLGQKRGTVGMPLPGTSFKIIDPQTEQELPFGTKGLILIGGAQVMMGYLGHNANDSKHFKTINDRQWYITGDLGILDEDGFLTVLGNLH